MTLTESAPVLVEFGQRHQNPLLLSRWLSPACAGRSSSATLTCTWCAGPGSSASRSATACSACATAASAKIRLQQVRECMDIAQLAFLHAEQMRIRRTAAAVWISRTERAERHD